MDRSFKLVEYFFWRIIALELLYAIMHSGYRFNIPSFFDTALALPSPLFVQQTVPRGWYAVGDCCKDARLQFATQNKELCLMGPYKQLFTLIQRNDCGQTLKYRSQALYIQ